MMMNKPFLKVEPSTDDRDVWLSGFLEWWLGMTIM